MSQTERILYIDRCLRSKGQITVSEIANKFEVSTRQIKRDIEYLRNRFSAPIIYSSTIKAYKYNKPFIELQYVDQKIIVSYVILKSLSENNQYIPVYSDEILNSLLNSMPKDYAEICKKVSYQLPQTETINPDFFVNICSSLKYKMCLEITYIDPNNKQTSRTVEPEFLINYSGFWYMICWDELRKELRIFNISRIKSLQETKQKFSSHPATYKKQLKDFISSAYGIFKGTETTNVSIKFSGTAAKIVEAQKWHSEQKIKILSDKENDYAIQLDFPVANFTEILGKILSYGANAVPLKPAKLCKMWTEEIQKLSKLI